MDPKKTIVGGGSKGMVVSEEILPSQVFTSLPDAMQAAEQGIPPILASKKREVKGSSILWVGMEVSVSKRDATEVFGNAQHDKGFVIDFVRDSILFIRPSSSLVGEVCLKGEHGVAVEEAGILKKLPPSNNLLIDVSAWCYQYSYRQIEKTSEYEKDPYFRWLDELPPKQGIPWLVTTSGGMRHKWQGDGVVCQGMARCNLCLRRFNSKYGFGLMDTYSKYRSSFRSDREWNAELQELQAHTEKHNDKIVHHFTFPNVYPGSGLRWPWDMTASSVAQEVLWEAFVEKNIPLSTYFGAVTAGNDKLLTLQVIRIIGVAIGRVRSQKEKVLDRMYRGGLIIPEHIADYMKWWDEKVRQAKPSKRRPAKDLFASTPLSYLNNIRRKGATDRFLAKVEELLEAQCQKMMEFPYLTLPSAYEGTVEHQVGYAWNSLCCFFYCGLVQKDSFPFVDYEMGQITYLQVVNDFLQLQIIEKGK
ncbi:unnamed protein product [Cylindrotheca closterium]|uniref:Uncharacterized protein n=1 Tax=Cylindrotheca closterium TaxID=2856 RepID=A0AAD2CIC0_9STRA|nr:unnamed protein product [Cylindrotheca closterium]